LTATPSRPAHQPRHVLPGNPGRGRRRLALAAAVVAALLLAGCAAGPTGGNPQPTSSPKAASPAIASPAAARPRTAPSVIAVPPPPAYLHQTMALPSAHTRVFSAEMTDLWAAVVAGRPVIAADAFFPLSAYRQVKAIADPTTDWHNRLFADFRLDVAAAHQLLGPGARKARLVRVIVPSAQASWIVPGVCFNGVGYWHVAGARVVYRQRGQLRSFGIASLISWRGRWYVVHFGAVLRNAAIGVVDQPSLGTGTPGPPGGC
jgi:hypothetical protein